MSEYGGNIRLTQLAQRLVARSLQPGGTAIDATVGNGHDTLFLAETVGPRGRVFGCDIQQTALDLCLRRLCSKDADAQVRLLLGSHDRLGDYIPPPLHGRIDAVMFNLGYLPGADKRVVTTPENTLKALQTSLALLSPTGVISVIAYTGHPGGREEAQAVAAWSEKLTDSRFEVRRYTSPTPAAAPVLTWICRQG